MNPALIAIVPLFMELRAISLGEPPTFEAWSAGVVRRSRAERVRFLEEA